MEVLLVLVPFVLAGIAVIFIAFSGGPSAAREAYLTRGGRLFTLLMVLLYLVLGVAVPAVVIANRGASPRAASGRSAPETPTAKQEHGKDLFIQTCRSCHTLAAVQAHGVTGPNLDELGPLDKQRVLNAIKSGGTGDGPHARRAARGRGRRRRGHLRVRGRRPLSAGRARNRPIASLVAFSPQAPGFSVRRVRSAASMAASIEAEALRYETGRGGPRWPVGQGRIASDRVAHLFQREPDS